MKPAALSRFWERVTRGDGCWEWQGTKLANGYGCLKSGGKMLKAHRAAWELVNGAISDGMCVCHRCDNPACVRPDHLFLGTNADNMADKVAKGRQPYGERSAQAKITEHDVVDIRTLRAFGARQSALARAFGVSQQLVSAICNRLVWSHV